MSGPMSDKIAVIGAGISGLYCSYLLEKKGYEVDLFEKSSKIGGRMASLEKSGFILDRGFHVLQTGYPLASTIFDYQAMSCQSFQPGALVIEAGPRKSKIWCFADPFRRPFLGIKGAINFFTSPFNLLRVGLLRWHIMRTSDEDIFSQSGQTTHEFLTSRGFSQSFIDRFFLPLFGGIFLESSLTTDARMFKFVFKNMSRGDMVLPKQGISAVPKYLFNKLQHTKLNLNADVEIINDSEITVEGKAKKYYRVIKAFDEAARKLTRSVWTIHFSAPKSPLNKKFIMLNSNVKTQNNLISHLAVPSDIQPSYAPLDKSLITVTIVGQHANEKGINSKDDIASSAIEELTEWFGKEVETWDILEIQHINAALPELTASDFDKIDQNNQFLECGDHTYHGSVEGALQSAVKLVKNL